MDTENYCVFRGGDWGDYEYYYRSAFRHYADENSKLVLRGGCLRNHKNLLRSAFRSANIPYYVSRTIGLRIVIRCEGGTDGK